MRFPFGLPRREAPVSLAAELAELRSAVHWSRELSAPCVPPGGMAEQIALERIAVLRDVERDARADTLDARRRRAERHWRRAS